MDAARVTAVQQWPKPKSVKALQSFLGFANFYRRFIKGFSTMAAPLTGLLKGKPQRLRMFSLEARTAFQRLKQAFTSTPILKLPDPEKPFLVEVNASEVGLGAVLSQRHGHPEKLYPCAFFSRKLTPAERNYDIGNRELLAVKAAYVEPF